MVCHEDEDDDDLSSFSRSISHQSTKEWVEPATSQHYALNL